MLGEDGGDETEELNSSVVASDDENSREEGDGSALDGLAIAQTPHRMASKALFIKGRAHQDR